MNRQLSSIPSHQYCRRPSGAHLDPGFTQKTVKFGSGKIMVWGYIQYRGAREICKVDGNIDSAKYQQILASQYIPNYKSGQIFQQNGAPCHTSGSTMKFLRGKKIKVLQGRPAQSPDMNIIEHIWGRIKRKLGGPSRKTFFLLLVHDEILVWFFIWYLIYFLRKIKCIDYNLIDYYLWQDFCPGRNWLVHHYHAINLISIYDFFLIVFK